MVSYMSKIPVGKVEFSNPKQHSETLLLHYETMLDSKYLNLCSGRDQFPTSSPLVQPHAQPLSERVHLGIVQGISI